jgi:hypothetical protein
VYQFLKLRNYGCQCHCGTRSWSGCIVMPRGLALAIFKRASQSRKQMKAWQGKVPIHSVSRDISTTQVYPRGFQCTDNRERVQVKSIDSLLEVGVYQLLGRSRCSPWLDNVQTNLDPLTTVVYGAHCLYKHSSTPHVRR